MFCQKTANRIKNNNAPWEGLNILNLLLLFHYYYVEKCYNFITAAQNAMWKRENITDFK